MSDIWQPFKTDFATDNVNALMRGVDWRNGQEDRRRLNQRQDTAQQWATEDRATEQTQAKRKESLAFIGQASKMLEGVASQPGARPEDVLSAYDRLAPLLSQIAPPEQIQGYRAAIAQDTLGTLRAVNGAVEKELKFMNAGSSVFVLDPTTGEQVRRYEGSKYMNVPEGGTVIEVGDDAPQGPAQAGGDMLARIAQAAPDAVVTSGYRTRERQDELIAEWERGGRRGVRPATNSHHLTGQAVDLVPRRGETVAQLAARLKAAGLNPLNEGDHAHLQWGGQQQNGARVVARGAPKQREQWEPIEGSRQRNTMTGEIKGIPGSAAEEKRMAAQEKAANALESQRVTARIATDTIREARGLLKGFGEAGIIGKRMSDVPGTRAYDLDRKIDTLKANLSFAALAEMRANSPTGGALGNVTERELALLGSTVASLDIGQSEKELRAAFDKIERHYSNYMRAMESAAKGPEKQRSLSFGGKQPASKPKTGGFKILSVE